MPYQLTSVDLVAEENAGVRQQHDLFLLPEHRILISGVVRRPDGSPAHGAVVQFFAREGGNLGPLLGHTFTDEDGHFLFGPLAPGTEYKVKIFYWDSKEQGVQAEVGVSGIFPPVVIFPPIAPLPPVATLPPPGTVVP